MTNGYSVHNVYRLPNDAKEAGEWKPRQGRCYIGLDMAWRSCGIAVVTENGKLGYCAQILVPPALRGNRLIEAYTLADNLSWALKQIDMQYDVCGIGIEDPSFLAAKLRGMTFARMKSGGSVPTQESIMLVAGGIGLARAEIGRMYVESIDRGGASDWRYFDISPSQARAVFNEGLTVPPGAGEFVKANLRLKGAKQYAAESVVARFGVLPDSEHVVDAAVIAWYVRAARLNLVVYQSADEIRSKKRQARRGNGKK